MGYADVSIHPARLIWSDPACGVDERGDGSNAGDAVRLVQIAVRMDDVEQEPV